MPESPAALRLRARRGTQAPSRVYHAGPRRPRRWDRSVQRRSLLRILAADADVPIVLVSAPAGYGKSILASQWAVECGRPAAVLPLDRAANDPIVLLNRLADSLEHLGRGAGERSALDPAATRTAPGAGRALAEELRRLSPVQLILDDLHELCEPRSLAVIDFLLGQIPRGSQLMLVTRADPAVALARQRVAGDLLELRASQLAFDMKETRALAGLRGMDLSGATLKAVHKRTEGWAAAIDLVLQASEESPMEVLDSFTGSWRDIADYLLDVVLARVSDEHRTFLLATSVLQRMTASLCDAVLENSDSAQILRELEHANSFLVPLDDEHTAYRYHQLFGEFLRSELDRRHPGLAQTYLARAARWHERDGSDPEEAFRCARECRDLRRAGKVALASYDPMMNRGEVATLKRWLHDCADEDICADPQLAIAAGWVFGLTGEGEKAQRYARAAELAELDAPSADGASSLRSSLINLRSALGYRGVSQMLADGEYVRDTERESGTRWLVGGCRAIGIANLLLGRPDAAIDPLAEGLLLTQAAELAAARVFCLGYLTFAALDRGLAAEARRYARDAKWVTGRYDLNGTLAAAVASTAKASVLAHDGDLTSAREQLAIGTELRRLIGGSRWMAADLELRWGDLSLTVGERVEAREHALRARAVLSGYPDPGRLLGRLAALEERLTRATDLGLTPAELRIVPFLPTHLSVKEIAICLHVAPATVKTHLNHLFDKLDVSTRSEAVERMEELGLQSARAPSATDLSQAVA